MFGFVKTWLRKSEVGNNTFPSAVQPKFSTVTAPARPVAGATPAIAVAKVVAVELPLSAIFNRLPSDLQGRVKLPVNGQALVVVPLGVVLPQLARGAVRITFGELRQMAGDLFYSQEDRDQAVVELPLSEILSRINPSLLPRRTQSAVQVPAEITSPFAGNAEGLNIYKPDVTPAAPFVRKADDTSVVPNFSEQGTAASAPIPPPPVSATIPAPAIPRWQSRTPAPRIQVAAAMPPAAVAAVPAVAAPVLTVALTELAAAWPPAVQMEIAQMNLTDAAAALPVALIGEALKKGRAVFPWRQVRSWLNSPSAAATSAHDAELLELPLKILAPLFLAQLPGARSTRQVAVDATIPDLFSGPEKPKPAAPAPALAEPKPSPIIFADTEITGKARSSDTPRSGTEFLRRYATPNDIVAKAAVLEGVAGVLITLADGLLVASQLPPNVNGDSLAAFTPQLYARVSQSAREYRMGDLKDLSFTLGNTGWIIFKVGAIFFAAFGCANAPLPVAELAALAAELDRKPKPQI